MGSQLTIKARLVELLYSEQLIFHFASSMTIFTSNSILIYAQDAGTPAARAARLTAMFGSALHELGVPYGVAHGYVLSSLRAGAITTLYQRCGDLQRVRWYGRWDSLRTMEHYV